MTSPTVNATPYRIETSVGGKLVTITSHDGGWGEERYAVNWREFDGLMGRMLTIADASFPDKEQRKAVKDLIRQSIREWAGDVESAAHGDKPGFDQAK